MQPECVQKILVADRVTVLNARGVIANRTPQEVQQNHAVMEAYPETSGELPS